MAVSTPTAYASLADLVGGSLPQEALRQAPSTLGPVVRTGTGAGIITPSGRLDVPTLLVGNLTIEVQVVVGGVPGVATFRYRIDGGAWSSTTTTPASGTVSVLSGAASTGVALAFSGTFVADDVYAIPVVSVIKRALDRWNARADAAVRRRVNLPPSEWGADIVGAVVDGAAFDVLKARGFSPDNPGDQAVLQGYKNAEAYLRNLGEGHVTTAEDTAAPMNNANIGVLDSDTHSTPWSDAASGTSFSGF